MTSWQTPELTSDLLTRHGPGPERGGVILDDSTIIEMINHLDTPEDGCVLDPEELLEFEGRIVATWHTHPMETAALSGMDWDSFLGWPDQLHVIVGTDGLRWYRVQGPAVVNA